MRKITIPILLLLSACSNQPISDKSKKNEFPVSKYSQLENLFKSITIDSLYIYSVDDLHLNSSYEFKGKAMDSVQVSLLPFGIKSNYNWNKDFGACFKFPLSNNEIALISRVPAEYISSAIKLFVFDIEKDSIVKTIDLANSWGDAGEASAFSSCIFIDKEKRMLMLTYAWSSYDHSVSDVENDSIVEYWNSYYLYDLTNNSIDTLSKDSAIIFNNYPNILKKLTRY